MCTLCQRRVKTAGTLEQHACHLQTTLDSEMCRNAGWFEAARGASLVTSVLCCKQPPEGSPAETALLRVREERDGEEQGSSGLKHGCRDFSIHVRVTLLL